MSEGDRVVAAAQAAIDWAGEISGTELVDLYISTRHYRSIKDGPAYRLSIEVMSSVRVESLFHGLGRVSLINLGDNARTPELAFRADCYTCSVLAWTINKQFSLLMPERLRRLLYGDAHDGIVALDWMIKHNIHPFPFVPMDDIQIVGGFVLVRSRE